uniref:Glycoside hydrolase family 9-like Ig-like protein n=1 Tax=uncultured bacterium contig00059 TaxID=1181542 RepID=A0A0A6ZH47_9BACT|nr:glycoside hydrolase family 9-like Ig-like protein [uncultured bacterium contig00059]
MSKKIEINISIDTAPVRPISPYIYGMNGVAPASVPPANEVTASAYRLGGNRTTGYNWENNLSNAGEDWQHFNDEYLVPRGKDGSIPAITVTDFVENSKKNGAAAFGSTYALITLPMAGYVSNDNRRAVLPEETAPSARFARIVNRKNRPLSFAPDLADGVVYQDEFINFLLQKLGSARNGGINGYSLDNEPALWPTTHPRIHPAKTTIAEILEKSISLASVVKDHDPDAEVFGPALYGVGAYATFQDAPDWKGGYANKYGLFIDAYLDGMRKVEEENGRRLLDVLDLHYYTEARCHNDHRVTEDRNNNAQCINTRLQSTRSLWDGKYVENSWVGRYLRHILPVLPVVNASINKYYPGTKLAITEYNFGWENHVSGGIAQADALGIFASHGVYLATLWPMTDNLAYSYAGINLYTNYDGKGGAFGGTLVKSATDNIEKSSVYASTDANGALHIILLNKSINETERFSVKIQPDKNYKTFTCYGFDAETPAIKNIDSGSLGENEENTFVYEMPPLSAYHFVLNP